MWILGYNMSVAVAIGFIALAGVAAETDGRRHGHDHHAHPRGHPGDLLALEGSRRHPPGSAGGERVRF